MELKNCGQCNGTLRFNKEKNLYICMYCDSEFKRPEPEKDKKGIRIGGVNISIDGLDEDDMDILNLDQLKLNKAEVGSFVKGTLIVAGILAILIMGVAIFFAFDHLGGATDGLRLAVSGTDNRPQTTQQVMATTAPAAPQPSDIVHTFDEAIVFQELTVTLNSVIFRRGGIFDEGQEGMQYVALKLTVENTSHTSRTFSSGGFNVFADNVRVNYNARAARNLTGTLGGSLSPGRIVIGYRGYIIPRETTELSLEIPSHIGGRGEMATVTFQITNQGEQVSILSVVPPVTEVAAAPTTPPATTSVPDVAQAEATEVESIITRETYALLQYGMSIEEVLELIGIPPFSQIATESLGTVFDIKTWMSGWDSIIVSFANGYLMDVSAIFW